MSKVTLAPRKEDYQRMFGKTTFDIRCPRGHKLMEVEKKMGSVVWVKCKNCGEVYRVEI